MPRNISRKVPALMFAILCMLVPQVVFGQPADDKKNQIDVQQGHDLAFDRSKGNCLACHQIEGGDLAGNIGPPLVDMKARFPDRQKLYDRVWDETKFNPMTAMPPFGRNKILNKPEIEQIVDFLYTL